MRARLEAFFLQEWQQGSVWQVVLRPLSWLFAALAATRRALYRLSLLPSTKVGVPVIVVGNISAGGTGKTPVVIALTEYLEKNHWRVGVITRGHTVRSLAVNVTEHEKIVASDEALMMSQRLKAPVFANASRVEAARLLLTKYPQTNVIISDDGLQHYALKRDLEIAVVDGVRGFGNGQLMPAGPLREPVARLESVDAIVVNGSVRDELALDAFGRPVYSMALSNEKFVMVRAGSEAMRRDLFLASLAGKRVHALAGIGNPERFFTHLKSLGVVCAATHAFADHHPFVATDLAFPDADMILMTEKDAVKCRAFTDDRMWFMRVDAALPLAFEEFVLTKLSALKAKS